MKDFKVRCTESRSCHLTTNKVYEVINGVLYADAGYSFSAWSDCGRGSKEPEALLKWFDSKFELIPEPQQFTKADLKTGMRVELRNGAKFVYFDNGKLKGFVQGIRSVYLDFYDDEFNCKRTGLEQSFDIMKVYDTPDSLIRIPCYDYSTKLLWQRPEIPKMTHKEIEQTLGHEFEYVKE